MVSATCVLYFYLNYSLKVQDETYRILGAKSQISYGVIYQNIYKSSCLLMTSHKH